MTSYGNLHSVILDLEPRSTLSAHTYLVGLGERNSKRHALNDEALKLP